MPLAQDAPAGGHSRLVQVQLTHSGDPAPLAARAQRDLAQFIPGQRMV